MNEIAIPCERLPCLAGDEGLAARRVVFAPGQIEKDGLGSFAVLRSSGSEMRAFIHAELDLEDARRGRPVSLLRARREKTPVVRKAESVRIAETGRKHLEATFLVDATKPLIARCEIPIPRRVPLEPDDEVMPARRGLHRVGDTLVVVRLVVAIEIVETGDLIAPEDVDLSIDDLHPERLMQAGGKAFPTKLPELVIDAAHEPDLAGHRRDGGAAVFEKVVRGEEEDRAVGILEGDRQRIGGEGFLRSDRALGLEPLRPLRRTALGHGSELFSIVATRVEVMRLAVRLVGKDHLFAMPIKPEVTPLAFRLRLRDDLALHRGSGHETVARVVQPDKPTFPGHREAQRQRIEDRGEIIETDAHALRQRDSRAFEDAAEDIPEIAFSPASVLPGDLVVLVAPVALLPPVHSGEIGYQLGQGPMRQKG